MVFAIPVINGLELWSRYNILVSLRLDDKSVIVIIMEGVTYASTILTRAVSLDVEKKDTESLVCYQEGIQILMDTLKKLTDDGQKEKIRVKVDGKLK